MLPPAQAPFELDLLLQQLIRPHPTHDGGPVGHHGVTPLSVFDCLSATTATARAWGFEGAQINIDALVDGLRRTITDLPFLGGRLAGFTLREHLRLGALHIEHTGAGALLTVVEAPSVRVACMAPGTWPRRGMTIADPAVPFYIEPLDVGKRLLQGHEPLMKVRLTLLADGCILSITLAHVITDGVRWPALAKHLAARYRQAVAARTSCGTRAAATSAGELLQPSDRRQLSVEFMTEELLGECMAWDAPPPPRVRWSLRGGWNLGRLLLADARQEVDLVVLHLPQVQVAALKQLAAAGNPAVTTGDAVQAAAALLLHAAEGRPLLPVAPKCMVALVQMPVPQGYFGNDVHMLRVSLPAGTPQPAAGDGAGALRTLASAIRAATAQFRSHPEDALRALQDVEALVSAPVHHMLSWLAAKRMPLLTCTTNYVPCQQGIDLGLGREATYTQGMTMPRGKCLGTRDMALIRPAVRPYADGLFLQLCLARAAADALRHMPLLQALLPRAQFVD